MKTQERSNPSLAWLMPSSTLWKDDEVLVHSTDGKGNVTMGNVDQFYLGLGHPENAQMRNDVKDLTKDLTPPGVEMYCLHGSQVPTTEQ